MVRHVLWTLIKCYVLRATMSEPEHWIFACDIEWDVPADEPDRKKILSVLPTHILLEVSLGQVLDYFADEEWLLDQLTEQTGWLINDYRHKYVGAVTDEDPKLVLNRLLFKICPPEKEDEPNFDLGIDWSY